MFFKNFVCVAFGGRRHGNSDTKIFQQQLTAPHTHTRTHAHPHTRTHTYAHLQAAARTTRQKDRQEDRRTDRRAGTLSDTYPHLHLHHPQPAVTPLE